MFSFTSNDTFLFVYVGFPAYVENQRWYIHLFTYRLSLSYLPMVGSLSGMASSL
jgi:hypothetical protein